MRFRLYLLALSFIFFLPKAEAFFCCDTFGSVEFQAEWIYFRPSIDTPILFVPQDANAGTQRDFLTTTHHHSGWRVQASYLFCDCLDRITTRFTRLQTRDSHDFAAAAFIIPFERVEPVGEFVRARDQLKFDFSAVEVYLDHRIICDCRFLLNFIAGFEYARASIRERIDLTAFTFLAPGLAKEHSRFWGIGPELGANFSFNLFNCLSLVGRGTGALLVSHVRGDETTRAPDGLLFHSVGQKVWKVIPAWDFRVGLRYESCFWCVNAFIEGGYETASFTRSFQRTGSEFAHFTQYDDFSLSGPYLALGIRY